MRDIELSPCNAAADPRQGMFQLYSEQDASGKDLICDLLFCVVVYGDSFFEEMEALLKLDKKEEMREALQRWTERAKARVRKLTKEQNTTGIAQL